MSGKKTIEELRAERERADREIARMEEEEREAARKKEEKRIREVEKQQARERQEKAEKAERAKAERLRKLAKDAMNVEVPKKTPGAAVARSITMDENSSGNEAQEVPGGSKSKKRPAATWAEDDERGVCKRCVQLKKACLWPTKGRGKSCEECVEAHATCYDADRSPPPKKQRGKGKEKSEEAEGGSAVVTELRKMRRMLKEELEEQTRLMEVTAKRCGRINKAATATLVELRDVALDLERLAGVKSGKRRFEFGDEVLGKQLEEDIRKDMAEDAEMGDPEEEDTVEKEVTGGEGVAE
jgi:hypothetical protein